MGDRIVRHVGMKNLCASIQNPVSVVNPVDTQFTVRAMPTHIINVVKVPCALYVCLLVIAQVPYVDPVKA